MNHRVALLIAGEYRTFETAIRTWDHLRDLELDVYVSTSGPSLTEHRIREVLTALPHATVKGIRIGNPSDDEPQIVYGVSRMILNWRYAVQLVDDSQLPYDALIVQRPDLMVAGDKRNFHAHLEHLDPSTLYLISGDKETKWPKDSPPTPQMNDQLFIGSLPVIRALSQVPYCELDTDIHRHLGQHLAHLPWKALWDCHPYAIVRPNVDPNHQLTFEYVRACAKEWWETTHGGTYEG